MKEIEIPEGYEAKIDGNKVILVPKESEDEKIRKELYEFIKVNSPTEDANRFIAWLEKQKEQKSDGKKWLTPEELHRIEQLRYEAGFDAGVRSEIEKQKEQKPSLAKIDNSRENVVFPFNAKVKDSDKVVTIIDGQLNFDGKQWIRFTSNKDDGFKEYYPEDLLVEQKPAEWSEEDDENLYNIIEAIKYVFDVSEDSKGSRLITWLKFICQQHHWKPSKEQMDILDKVYHYLWADRNATADMQDGLGDFIDELKSL